MTAFITSRRPSAATASSCRARAYVAPPEQGKHDPFASDRRSGNSRLASCRGHAAAHPPMPDEDSIHFGKAPKPVPAGSLSPDKLIVAAFSGISPLLAKEIAYRGKARTGGSLPNGLDELKRTAAVIWPVFREMIAQFRERNYEPQIVVVERRQRKIGIFRNGADAFGTARSAAFDTISACLEAFYGDKAQRDTVKQRVSDLIRFLQNERNKNEKKLDKLRGYAARSAGCR